jgi:hypothetical protein
LRLLVTYPAAKLSSVPAVAASTKSKKNKDKTRRDSLDSQSAASPAADESPSASIAPANKKHPHSQRDRSDSLESASSQSSTQSQSQHVAENKNVSFAEKPVELEKKQSPPDLKKQAPSILKQSKTPPSASSVDANPSASAPSRAAPPLHSNGKSTATAPSSSVSSGSESKSQSQVVAQSQVAAAGSLGDPKASQNGRVSPASEPNKSAAPTKSVPAATQQPQVSAPIAKAAPPKPAVVLPNGIAHLQPAVSAADRSRGDTLEWNVALDSSDGIEGLVPPGPSTLHSIDKMYRSMSAVPSSFSQSTQPAVRSSVGDASVPQSVLDDAVLKAKAKEKIKQFVVGDASAASSFVPGAQQFVASSRAPAPVTRAFSAPPAAIPQPSHASNQSWQIPAFVPENSFPTQQQSFPSSNRPLNDLSSIWGGAPSATPAPFTATLATSTWGLAGSFSSVPPPPPQQPPSIAENVAAPQPSPLDESLFFFESIDE